MSKRILMRLGKSPLEVQTAWDAFNRNSIGGNNGNLIFGYGAHRLLSARGVEVEPNRYKIGPEMADEVNANYDGFVLPLANAFRPDFQQELHRTTRFIEKLKIPFMMLSGGAQLPLDGNAESLKPIEDSVKQFARAVLDKSSALSVRGHRTAEYLEKLGIRDVEVIGCPSLTLLAPEGDIRKRSYLPMGGHVAYNIETSKDIAGPLVQELEDQYEAVYFPQDRRTFEMMIWATDPYPNRDPRLPLSWRHPQFSRRRAEFHFDAPTWIHNLTNFDFSVGPRIHGNIAALIAGTPAVVLAHDSRTLELAEYHEIPYRRTTDLEGLSVADLFDDASFGAFNSGRHERLSTILKFVTENGFDHIFSQGSVERRTGYDQSVSDTQYGSPLRPGDLEVADENVSARLYEIRKRLVQQDADIKKLRREFQQLSREQTSHVVQTQSLSERLGVHDYILNKLLRWPRRLKRLFRRSTPRQ